MKDSIRQELLAPIEQFHLPRYEQIPTVGLYLEQVTRLLNSYLTKINCPAITASMISNYVKQKTVPGPVKKSYGVDSIAYLFFVSFIKMVMSMDDIRMLTAIQQSSYSLPVAYNYFCDELENLLQYVFGIKNEPEKMGISEGPEKELLRSALLSAAHKIYLDNYLQKLRQEN